MQLQGTKISNKGQQDQQKQKHPKQQQQAEKSARRQQSSARTMGHGNPEESPESFARFARSLRSPHAKCSPQERPKASQILFKTRQKAFPDRSKIHKILNKIYEKIWMAIKSPFRGYQKLAQSVPTLRPRFSKWSQNP